MDLGALVNELRENQTLHKVVNNPRVQFGTPSRPLIGSTILPERNVTENYFMEDSIRYRTVVANAGTRYSPVQIKGADSVGSMEVKLADSDIGRELSGREYDAILKILKTKAPMAAIPSIVNWVDVVFARGLADLREKYRWDALVDAQITMDGDNNYREVVNYSNPSGARSAAGGSWSSDAYDPLDDIIAKVDYFHEKGFTVTSLYASRTVISKLRGNANMQRRGGAITVQPGNTTLSVSPSFLDLVALNGILSANGIPPIVEYNTRFRTQTGDQRFLKDDVLVFICATGRDDVVDLGDQDQILPDTLGYTALGVPAGQADPGIRLWMQVYDDKPPRIEGKAWQTMLPVITEPEAVGTIHTIT